MKKVKIVTIVLAIILVTMIAFAGLYTQVQNRMENQIKDYEYAMDLKGRRNIRLEVDKTNQTVIKDSEGKIVENVETLTDEQITQNGYIKEEIPTNAAEILNEKNYINTKNIIEKRLEKLGVDNYIIKLDSKTGDIVVEIAENEMTDYVVSSISTIGKFEIVDSETNEVLMDNKDIKLVNVMYGTDNNSATSTSTAVYLNIEFTKEGAEKLEDITNKYIVTEEVKTENTDSENSNETEGEQKTTKEKKVTLKIDDSEIMSTSFEEPIKTGTIQLSIGTATTNESVLQQNIKQASNIATILDGGNMPIKYAMSENQYVLSDITNEDLKMVKCVIIAVSAILLLVLIIRHKVNGLIGAISHIGLAAIFVLLIKYTNVELSIEGIFGIVIVLILNYTFVNKILTKIKEEKINKNIIAQQVKDSYKEFFIKIIPVCITSITFCFIKWSPISSFGMVMFWGILLIASYNLAITRNLLKLRASK